MRGRNGNVCSGWMLMIKCYYLKNENFSLEGKPILYKERKKQVTIYHFVK